MVGVKWHNKHFTKNASSLLSPEREGSHERGREEIIYNTLHAMRKASVGTGNARMGVATHPGEVTKGSLEEAMKV